MSHYRPAASHNATIIVYRCYALICYNKGINQFVNSNKTLAIRLVIKAHDLCYTSIFIYVSKDIY